MRHPARLALAALVLLAIPAAAAGQDLDLETRRISIAVLTRPSPARAGSPPPLADRLDTLDRVTRPSSWSSSWSSSDDAFPLEADIAAADVQRWLVRALGDRAPEVAEAGEHALALTGRPEDIDLAAAMLARMERRLARRLRVDLLIVPPAVLDAVDPGWREAGAAPWREVDVIERAARAAGDAARRWTARARHGERRSLAPASLSLRLADHHISQTGALPAPCIDVKPFGNGLFADIEVVLAPAGDAFRADLVVGEAAAPAARIEKRPSDFGEIELSALREERYRGTIIAPFDRTVVVAVAGGELLGAGRAEDGNAEDTGRHAKWSPRDAAFLLRVRAEPATAAEDAAGAGDAFAVLAAGALLHRWSLPRRPRDRPWFWWSEQGAGGISIGEPARATFGFVVPHELEDLLSPLVDAAAGDVLDLGEGRDVIVVQAPMERRTAVQERLATLFAERIEPVAIDIRCGLIDASALEPGEHAAISFESLETADVAARVLAVAGETVWLTTLAGREVVADFEHVSGGASEVVIEMSDTIIGFAATGIDFAISTRRLDGADCMELHVQGDLIRSARVSRGARAGAVPPRPSPFPAAAGVLAVDRVELDGDVIDATAIAYAGRPVLLRAVSDPENPGKLRAIIARVNRLKASAP